jgi:Putative zinc-finger
MGCRRYRKALSEAAAGALAPERRRELDGHLAQCAECTTRLDRLQSARVLIYDALSESAAAEPSHEWLRKIEQRLAVQTESHRPRIPYGLVTAVAAAVIGIAAAWTLRGLLFVPPQPRPAMAVVRATIPAPTKGSEPKAGTEPLAAARSPHVARGPRVRPALREAARVRDQIREATLVPAGEKAAVLQLYRLLQSGKVDTRSLLRPTQAVDKRMSIAPLNIKMLSIAPLETSNDSGGQQQKRSEEGTKKETTP